MIGDVSFDNRQKEICKKIDINRMTYSEESTSKLFISFDDWEAISTPMRLPKKMETKASSVAMLRNC
jgi:hypothetical protein